MEVLQLVLRQPPKPILVKNPKIWIWQNRLSWQVYPKARTGPAPGTVVPGTAGEEWEADRRAVAVGSLSLAGLLRRRRLVARTDLLRPWSRWI